ncbi:substrate-binding periplasmic protein [Massilia glaciei]|nr:transporter substrate-binding domain-containing protein [Massilia glaciei]
MALPGVLVLGCAATAAHAHSPAEGAPLLLVNAPYPPYVNPPGDPTGEGIDVEIAREALRRGGYTVALRVVPWKRALAMLERGEADFTTTISRSGDRNRYLAWSPGYRNSVRYRFYGRKGGKVTLRKLSDLDGRNLGLTVGFFYPPAITDRLGVSLQTGASVTQTVRMLDAGRADFIVVNGLAGAWEIKRLGLGEKLELQPLVFASDSPTYMAFSKGRDHALPLAAMSAGLKSMEKDGSLARIEKKYAP